MSFCPSIISDGPLPVMGLLVAKFGDEEPATTLNGLTQVRDSWRQSAIARFGDANPFLDPTA
jgi:hypothetical protein